MNVSVIVPLYNKVEWVDRCLDSIFRQSFGEFEVIVVDDGSTDGSGDRVRRYRDPRLRVLTQPNLGPGAARNHGVAKARGDLLAFLDADDWWEDHYLRESVMCLRSESAEVGSLTWGLVEHPPGISTEARWRKLGIPEGVYRVNARTPTRLLISIVAHMLPSATVVRADAFRRCGGFYDRSRCLYSEDAWLWLKMLLHYAARFHAKPMVHKDNRAAGLSRNLTGVRPVEPFLLYPEEIEAECPEHLAGLLRDFLAARAAKTAAVYGYWGRWSEAKVLVKRYLRIRHWRHPYFIPALVAATRLGALAGSLIRRLGPRLVH